MKIRIALGIIIIVAILYWGCEGVLYYYTYPKSQYRELNLSKISLGMSEKEVRNILGEPADVIGSRYYEGKHIIKVLQYLEAEFSYTDEEDRLKKNYYLYFLDDELVQWGRPGDWEKEADKIYEIRIIKRHC